MLTKIKNNILKNELTRNLYLNFVKVRYYKRFKYKPQELADEIFYKEFKRHIDWKNPCDLNEKINWLKFHYDQHEWADLADKYKVRTYVVNRGLENILVPLYGKYDDVDELLEDWENLPDEFIIKSNNGCSHVLIVSNDSKFGKSKKSINIRHLKRILNNWMNEKYEGIVSAEMHYQYIQNCIIVEKLLKDDSVKDESKSLVDYKIYCANGTPCVCYVAFDRDPITHERYADLYDIEWKRRNEMLNNCKIGKSLDMPRNWDLMLKYARILSEGHPQVRVDFYNINGTIYFGEMTFTSSGGFDKEFKPEILKELGQRIKLNLDMPGNEFSK